MKPFLIFILLIFTISAFGQSRTYLFSELNYPFQFEYQEEGRWRMGGTIQSSSEYENTRINIRPALGIGYLKSSDKMSLDLSTQLRYLSGKADFYDYYDGIAYDGELSINMLELSANINLFIPINEILQLKVGGLLSLNSSGVMFDGIKQIQYEYEPAEPYYNRIFYTPPLEMTHQSRWNFPNESYGFSVSCIEVINPNLSFYAKYVFRRSFQRDFWNHQLSIQYISIGFNYYLQPKNQ